MDLALAAGAHGLPAFAQDSEALSKIEVVGAKKASPETVIYKSGLKVGTSAVAGIRTGWHARPEGHEQHVVVDLAGPDVRLEGFEALGSRIVLKLAKR